MSDYRFRKRNQTPAMRSTYMDIEEIRREREASGWNPYKDEEEPYCYLQKEPDSEYTGEDAKLDQEPTEPFFQWPEYSDIMKEQRRQEQDLRIMQSLYPQMAKLCLPYIEEECDRMEYDGSMMYHEYPDKTTICQITDRIYDALKEDYPDLFVSGQTLPAGDKKKVQHPTCSFGDMVQVMLIDEMHHRRNRRDNSCGMLQFK